MTHRRLIHVMASPICLGLFATVLVLLPIACANNAQPPAPTTAPSGETEVVGTLVSLKDDRPADGGVDLTLQTGSGTQEEVRVGSAFIAGPRDTVLAMHAVVDSSKVGDRLRAVGTRDETGALRARLLERVP